MATKKKPESEAGAEALAEQEHWLVSNEVQRRLFHSRAAELGLNDHDKHLALGAVSSSKEFEGSCGDALQLLEAFAAAKMAHEYTEAMARMPEAPMLAWTRFQKGPGKPTWTVSLRGGLSPELGDFALRDVMGRIKRFENWLEENDYRPVYDGRDQMAVSLTAPKPLTPQQDGPPTTGASPGVPPPPLPPGDGAPPPQEGQEGQEHQESIDYIKIAATDDGKPVIQFWRSGRKYPELKYNLSAEKFFKNVRGANWFLEHGYKQKNFEAVAIGQVYQVPMSVYWVKSPKSPTGKVWKDIVAIVAK